MFVKIKDVPMEAKSYNKAKSYTKKQKYLLNKKFLYFTCVFINYNCIIDSCDVIKYKAKQKHLLPFYVTNNKLKTFHINNIL